MKINQVDCPKCRGTGKVPDITAGPMLAEARAKARFTVTEIARATGYSNTYIKEIEQGKKAAPLQLVEKYLAALNGTLLIDRPGDK